MDRLRYGVRTRERVVADLPELPLVGDEFAGYRLRAVLGYVAGPVHEDVWNWWVGVHHNIGFAGAPMNM